MVLIERQFSGCFQKLRRDGGGGDLVLVNWDKRRLTAVVFAVVTNHEHNFPDKHVVVIDQTTGNARDVLAGLHLA